VISNPSAPANFPSRIAAKVASARFNAGSNIKTQMFPNDTASIRRETFHGSQGRSFVIVRGILARALRLEWLCAEDLERLLDGPA
jgi:hypothetical protein